MSHFRIQRKKSCGYKVYSEESQSHSLPKPTIKQISKSYTLSSTIHPKEDSHLTRRKPTFAKDSKLQEAMQAYKAKNTRLAVTLFKQIYKTSPSPNIAYLIGSCLLDLNRNQASIVYLNHCLREAPTPTAYLYVSINFKRLQNMTEAIKVLEQGVKRYPQYQEGVFYLGKLYQQCNKMGQAIACFKRVAREDNPMAYILLGDCSLSTQYYDQAIDICTRYGSQHLLHTAILHKVRLLINREDYSAAHPILDTIINSPSAEIYYYKGKVCYEMGDKFTAEVYLETVLSRSMHSEEEKKCMREREDKEHASVIEALILLMRMHVEDKDFFGALHLEQRAINMGIREQHISLWMLFIEGVNDLIKRKVNEGVTKLEKALKKQSQLQQKAQANRRTVRREHVFLQLLLPYYGYALYLSSRFGEAKDILSNCMSKVCMYNRWVIEGLIQYEANNSSLAQDYFSRAYQEVAKIQCIFMQCIVVVRTHFQHEHPQNKDPLQQKLYKLLKIPHQNSLLYFYTALVDLYFNRTSLQSIENAIELNEEQVSEYYFIKAMIHSQRKEYEEGLQCMDTAIFIQNDVQQFYKERSKYYCLLNRYDEAILDCRKCNYLHNKTEGEYEQMEPTNTDEEADLLLTFYYYLNAQYETCHSVLKRVKKNNENKFGQFTQAIMLRVKEYEKAGPVGKLIQHVLSCSVISQPVLDEYEKCCQSNIQYAQVTTYFWHALLGIYYGQQSNYTDALRHFYHCLEQLNLSKHTAQNNEIQIHFKTLYQTKFNILLICLLKQSYQQSSQILQLLLSQQTQQHQQLTQLSKYLGLSPQQTKQQSHHLTLDILRNEHKVSDEFKAMEVVVNGVKVRSRFVLRYPSKLQFNIVPQFDKSYLYNFGMEKVEQKTIPPWIRDHFTDQIINQEPFLSQTGRSTPSCNQDLRLDSQLQRKLNALLKK